MADLPRRPNYFQSQFLVVRDFEDEQAYHEGMLRRHNRLMHEWGVVRDGLQVTKTPDNQNLSISPGSAIDSLGREIVLESARLLSLDDVRKAARASDSAQDVSVTISFLEIDSDRPEDKYPPPNGTVNATRKMQSPLIEATKSPATDGTVVRLARVAVPGDDVGQPDNSVRRLASSFIAPLDGGLSFAAKNSPTPQVGLDYDADSDTLRIRARTKDAPTLDATHLTIKRATGNVGIGTTKPSFALQVGDVDTVGSLRLCVAGRGSTGNYRQWTLRTGDGDNTADIHKLRVRDEQAAADRLIIDQDGNVGIGTTSPGANSKLEVAGKVKATSFEGILDASNITGKLGADKIEGQLSQWMTGQGNISYSAGNVGIGTPEPTAVLHLRGKGEILLGNLVWFPNGTASSQQVDMGVFLTQVSVGDLIRMGPDVRQVIRIIDNSTLEVAGTFSTITGGSPIYLLSSKILAVDADDKNLLAVNAQGNVGIGTSAPTKAKLQIEGGVSTEVTGYGFLNRWEANKTGDKLTASYSIWATNRIGADEFNAFSDERIKNIQGRSDSATDLRTLLGIEVTDYRHKDVIGKGNGAYKKVIGQQVEKVFPQAVSKNTDVVPDIYQQASIRDGWVALATDLKRGERVKLIAEQGEEGVHEVLEVTEDKFRVDFKHEEDRVFVFGREVNDLRTVDYDAIAMLNVSATQQLKKEKDDEVKALRAEIAELKAANDALTQRLRLLESRMETVPNFAAAKRGSHGNGSNS